MNAAAIQLIRMRHERPTNDTAEHRRMTTTTTL
jgi:hypothetical protein